MSKNITKSKKVNDPSKLVVDFTTPTAEPEAYITKSKKVDDPSKLVVKFDPISVNTPHIYVYDTSVKENKIVQYTPHYILHATHDSNLAGEAFFQRNKTQIYVKSATDIEDELTRNKLVAFGIQMNKAYTEQRQEKERQEKMTADSKNSKQINSVGDILVKDSLPQLGYALQMLVGSVGYAATLGLSQDVKDFTAEAAKGWFGKYTDTIEDTTNLTKDLYIDPMVDGEWLTLLSNTMVNLGETMDVVTGTAAAKYMLQNDDFTSDMGGYTERLMTDPDFLEQEADKFEKGNPYAWNEETGRPNWDWNTGNFVSDIALEIASDPTTWLTMGTSSAIKGGAKSAAQTITDSTVESVTKILSKRGIDIAGDVADELGTSLKKSLTNALRNTKKSIDPDTLTVQITKSVLGSKPVDDAVNSRVLSIFLEREGVSSIDELTDAAFTASEATKTLVKQNLLDEVYSTVRTTLTNTAIQSQLTHLDSLRGISKGIDAVQREATNASRITTFLAPVAIAHYVKNATAGTTFSDVLQGVFSTLGHSVRGSLPKLTTGAKHVLNKFGNKLKQFYEGVQTASATEEIMKCADDTAHIITEKFGIDGAEELSKVAQTSITKLQHEKFAGALVRCARMDTLSVASRIRSLNKMVTVHFDGEYKTLEDYIEYVRSLPTTATTDTYTDTYLRILEDFSNNAPLLLEREILDEFSKPFKEGFAFMKDEIKLFPVSIAPNQHKDVVTYIEGLRRLSKNPILTNNRNLSESIQKLLNTYDNTTTFANAKSWQQFFILQEEIEKGLKESVDSLDAKICSLNSSFSKDSDDYIKSLRRSVDKTVMNVNSVLKQVEETIEGLEVAVSKQEQYAAVVNATAKVQAKDMPYEKLYGIKLSNQARVRMFMDDPNLQEYLSVLNSDGALNRFLKDWNTPECAEILKIAAAYDNYAYVLRALDDIDMPEELRAGFLDAIINRATYKGIDNAEAFTQELAQHAKRFVDTTAHKHDLYFTRGFNTPDTYTNVQRMLKEINNENTELSKLYKEMATEDKVNVTFSVARTQGGISEVTFHVPEGKLEGTHTFRLAGVQDDVNVSFVKTQYDMDMKHYYRSVNKRPDVKVNKGLHVFENRDEFSANIAQFIKEVQTYSKANGAQRGVRLIGANSAEEALGHSKALSDLFSSNRAKIWLRDERNFAPDAYSLTTRDLLQELNVTKGAIVIDDYTYKSIENMVKELQQRLNNAVYEVAVFNGNKKYIPSQAINKYRDLANVQLAPVFDENFVKNLDNLIKKMDKPTAEMDAFTLTAMQDLKKLRNEVADILDTQHKFEGLLSGIGLSKVTAQTNVMHILQDPAMKLPYGTLSVVKKFDSSIFSKMNAQTYHTPAEWLRIYDTLKETEQVYRTITNMPLMQEVAQKVDREAMWNKIQEDVLTMLQGNVVISKGNMNEVARYSGRFQEQIDMLSAYLPQNRGHVSDVEDLIMLHSVLTQLCDYMSPLHISKGNRGIYQDYLKVIADAGYNTALEHTKAYNPYLTPLIDSFYYKEDSSLGALIETVEAIDKGARQCDTLERSILYDELVQEVHGWHTSEAQIKIEAIKNFKNYYNHLRATIEQARTEYHKAIAKNPSQLGIAKAKEDYNHAIETLQKVNNTICKDMTVAKLEELTKFNVQKYMQYLYKYCKGRQVIYTNADIFLKKEGKDFLTHLRRHIIDAADGIHSYKDADGRLFIWLDKSVAESEDFIEKARTLKLNSIKPKEQASNQAVLQFLDSMDTVTENSYRYSNHTAFDEFHYQEVTDFFERHGIKDTIDIEHFKRENAFLGSYNHTVIGDYGDGVGEIFSKTSRNPISNFASGFNSAYNFMATKENYATLLFNRQHSLAHIIGDTPIDEAMRSIRNHNLVACKLKDGKVMRITIHGKGHLQRLMKDEQVCLLNYVSYTSAVEHLNDNVFSNSLYKFLNRYWLAPIKIGQLASPGWAIRNTIDSSTKGAFQSGRFFDFYKMFNTTKKILDQFDRTYAMIYKETEGNMSKKNIAAFFVRHSEDEGILGESLYKKLLQFFDSSSASPTARQLDLQQDIMSLLRKRTKDLDIPDKEKHLKTFYDFYKKNLELEDREFVRQFIKQNPDVPEEIGRLIYTIPKQSKELLITKMPTVKAIMNVNNKVETLMRAHVFLYQTEYCSGLSDAAYHMVDMSQFNTTRNSKVRKLFDQIFPFSSFAIDNLLYYIDLLGEDTFFQKLVYQAMPEPFEELSAEDMMENKSLAYAILNGNIMLNDSGLYLKTNYSLFSAFQFLMDPIGTTGGMLHTSVDSAKTLFQIMHDCWEEGQTPWKYFDAIRDLQQEYYDNGGWLDDEEARNKIYDSADAPEALQALLNLIPMLGVTWQRWTSPTAKSEVGDSILQWLFPGLFSEAQAYADRQGWLKDATTAAFASTPIVSTMFGAVKDNNKPVGYDWYEQDAEYRRTHQYVPGVSYVPSFLSKDPTKYVDTYGHLLQAGYSEKTAWQMMREGWKYDVDASTFYNSIASWDYYIIQNGYRKGISEDLVDVYKQQGYTVYKNEEKIPYWLASKKGNAIYTRTYKYYEAMGLKPAEIIGKMAEGWYIAVTGDLVNRADLNERDEKAYKQLKLWQEGKAPFPADYVTKEERINPQGDGDTFAEHWYKKNGFKYMENMWLDPDTGEVYFKETKKSKEYFQKLYDSGFFLKRSGKYNSGYTQNYSRKPYVPYTMRVPRPRMVYPKKSPNSQKYADPYSPRVYYSKFNINKYSPRKYKNGTVTTPVAKSYKVPSMRSTRMQTYPTGIKRRNSIVTARRKVPKNNQTLVKIKVNRYKHSVRQYRFDQLRFWGRY